MILCSGSATASSEATEPLVPGQRGRGGVARVPRGREAQGRGWELRWQEWGPSRAPSGVGEHRAGLALRVLGCALRDKQAPVGRGGAPGSRNQAGLGHRRME